jgi:methionyl-tRNA formyltransferase
MRIAIFLSGQIGVELLFFLIQNNQPIHLIITKNTETDLYEFLNKQLPNFKILKYQEKNILKEFKKLKIELNVIGCFHILPKDIWNYPKNGTINLHYSLLPSYKGPHPLEWQIHFKEKYFGLSIHQLTDKIDEGPLLYQQEFKMLPDPTVPKLIQFLIPIGNEAMNNVINNIKNNSVNYVQSNYPSSYYSFYSETA